MRRPCTYNTKQGEAILAYIASLEGQAVTVEQIDKHLKENNIGVGLTTIYRNLDKLLVCGKIRKYVIEGVTGACFQYVQQTSPESEHVHLKCEDCGQLYRMKCDKLEDLGQHVEHEHAFRINTIKTVFYGTCKNCSRAGCEDEP